MIADAITFPLQGDHSGSAILRGGGISLLVSVLGMLATVLLLGAFIVELLDLAYGVAILDRLAQYSAMTAAVGAAFGAGAVLVQMTVTGYYVRVIRSTTRGESEMPPFDRFARAFKDGVVTTAILVVYFLPFFLVVSAVFALGVLELDTVASSGSAVTVVAVLVVLFVSFVFPAAVTKYAATGSVLSGFAFGSILAFLVSKEYLVAWGAGLSIWVVGLVVGSLIGSVIPVLGTLFVPFVTFVAGVPAYRLLGLAHNRGARNADVPGTTST